MLSKELGRAVTATECLWRLSADVPTPDSHRIFLSFIPHESSAASSAAAPFSVGQTFFSPARATVTVSTGISAIHVLNGGSGCGSGYSYTYFAVTFSPAANGAVARAAATGGSVEYVEVDPQSLGAVGSVGGSLPTFPRSAEFPTFPDVRIAASAHPRRLVSPRAGLHRAAHRDRRRRELRRRGAGGGHQWHQWRRDGRSGHGLLLGAHGDARRRRRPRLLHGRAALHLRRHLLARQLQHQLPDELRHPRRLGTPRARNESTHRARAERHTSAERAPSAFLSPGHSAEGLPSSHRVQGSTQETCSTCTCRESRGAWYAPTLTSLPSLSHPQPTPPSLSHSHPTSRLPISCTADSRPRPPSHSQPTSRLPISFTADLPPSLSHSQLPSFLSFTGIRPRPSYNSREASRTLSSSATSPRAPPSASRAPGPSARPTRTCSHTCRRCCHCPRRCASWRAVRWTSPSPRATRSYPSRRQAPSRA